MVALSFSRSSSFSHLDTDVSMFMDTSHDFEPSQGGGVRWVASQSTNPALQALMKEAERDRRTRPSTPVDEPTSWTYPLTSTTSSMSLSTSVSSAWHSSARNSADSPYPPPLSGSSSPTSSSSLGHRASEPSVSRRAQPLSAAQRRPLASSTSSTNQPPRHSVRPRSSSHSTQLSRPSTSNERYTPRDDEPEAMKILELLEVTCSRVDENSKMKQQVVRANGKQKEREKSLEKSNADDDNRKGLDTNDSRARPVTKTMSASAVYPVTSSTRVPEKPLTTSLLARRPEPRGRTSAKESGFGAPGVHPVSGKSTPTSLPSSNLKCDPKPVPAPRLPAGASNASNRNLATARKASSPAPMSNDGDTAMQDVIELTDSDTECKKPLSGWSSRADTAMCIDLDDEESDTGMDVSFYKPQPPPRARVPAPKPEPQPQPSRSSMVPRPAAATQRTRTGPPPLGMRRAPQLQPSQYGSTQASSSKGVTAPRFKPPLLTNARGTTTKNGSGTKLPPASSLRPPPRGNSKAPVVAETARAAQKDPDSSFDVSFDVDADALEEAMKAYD